MPVTEGSTAVARQPVVLANGLKWLAPEIDASLNRVRIIIDLQQEAESTEFETTVVLAELKLVLGALLMANCQGGAMFAEELCATVEIVANGTLAEPASALAAVSGATLQLSDYLDALRQSAPDRAAVLQPAISELRLACGRVAVTEVDLFVQQMQRLGHYLPVEAQSGKANAVGTVAARLLPAFQTLLLQWLKGVNAATALLTLRKVGDHLSTHATRPEIILLWSAFAAAIDSLLAVPDVESLELRRWIGRMAQQIKLLAEQGEDAAAQHASEATWRLLAHAAVLHHAGSRWQLLRQQLSLDATLPIEPALSAARQHLRGTNTRLLEKVAEEVRVDLALVKDGLDLAQRAGGLSPEGQGNTRDRLLRIANTLLLLGLPQLEQVILNQFAGLAGLGAAEGENQGQWLRIATALLRVEHSLETALFRPLRQMRAEPSKDLLSEQIEAVPHMQDLREGITALLREMLVDLAKLKAQFDGFLKGGSLRDAKEPLQLLSEVASGLLILDRLPAAKLASQLRDWLFDARPEALRLDPTRASHFADAVAALEIYLEALRDALPQPESVLETLAVAVQALLPPAVVAEWPARRAPETAADLSSPGLGVDTAIADAAPAPAVSLPETVVAATPVAVADEPAVASEVIDSAAVLAAEDAAEIRDIFIEEAGEVLVVLQRQLPLWQRDPTEAGVLADIRRAFHTLKGSGRMVGATGIAELSWVIEHLLNRCIEGSLPVNSAVGKVVEVAIQQLPALLTAYSEGSGTANAGTETLMARAHFLASGHAPEMVELEVLEVFRADALDRLADIERWLADAGQAGVDPDAVRSLHTIKGSAAVVNAEPLSQLAGALEGVLKQLLAAEVNAPPEVRAIFTEVLPVLRNWSSRAGEAETPDAGDWLARVEALRAFLPPPGETKNMARRDSVVNLAFDRLQIVERRLMAWTAAPADAALGSAVADAAEALMIVSQECMPLARSAQAMAERLRAPDIGTVLPDAGFFLALARALEHLYQFLDAYREGGIRESGRELAEMLRQLPLSAAPLATTETDAGPVLASDDSIDVTAATEASLNEQFAAIMQAPELLLDLQTILQAMPQPQDIADHELAELFVEEARELLAVLNADTPNWQLPAPVPVSVQHALHTLIGSARMAGYPALGDMASWFERRLLSLDPGTASAVLTRAELLTTLPVLEQAIDAFGRMIVPPQPMRESASDFVFTSAAEAYGAAPAEVQTSHVDAGGADPAPPQTFYAVGTEAADDTVRAQPGDGSIDNRNWVPEPPPPMALEPILQLPPSLLDGMDPPWPDAADEAQGARESAHGRPFAVDTAAEAIDPELAQIFIAEAAETLETIDAALADWRRDAGDASAVGELLRALHTLKGGARMTGFMQMGDASHEIESRLSDLLRRTSMPTAEDHAVLRADLETLEHMHDALARGHYGEAARPVDPAPPVPSSGAADRETAPEMPQAERLSIPEGWDAGLFWQPQEDSAAAASRRELARVPVEKLDAMLNEAGEISIYRSRLEQRNAELVNQLAEMRQTIVRLREQLRLMDIETDAQIAARGLNALGKDDVPDRYEQDFDPLEMDRYSRMQELSRALTEAVGDLTSLHLSMDQGVNEAQALLLQQGRINTGVQQGLMSTLMVPFSRQVARLQRVVRQTAQEQGKEADVQFEGVESELDRNVLERMTAPLEHLLRNAVVHGLEDPGSRSNAGKPAEGRVSVSLKREGTQLVMEIADDGRGLNLPAIRSKAIERGLLPIGAELGDDEIARFIFEPGFSTAEALTQVAGRGVGMDVVASEVKQLGGSLELHSEHGQGTRFTVRLPLSLALSQALMVKVGEETYALPLVAIEGIGRVPRAVAAAATGGGEAQFSYGGNDYRVRYLAELIDQPQTLPDDVRTVPAVLVRLTEGIAGGERRVALIIDTLLGNREVVSKSVGPQLSSISGVAGATILPSGEVVLILDPAALVIDRARRRLLAEASASRSGFEAQATQGGRLILVVDDSVTMRRVAERLLQRNGYRVITAKDGLEAIAQLQTESPAAILLDIEMPRADGFEVAGFVRNSERIQETPIIMITSRSGDKHRARAAALGVDRYLIKPYQEEQLLHELRALLQAREASAA